MLFVYFDDCGLLCKGKQRKLSLQIGNGYDRDRYVSGQEGQVAGCLF